MKFTSTELEDIREALFLHAAELDESFKYVETVIKTLDEGGTVPMFASGSQGVRAAQEMAAGIRVRRERLEALAVRISDELYGDDEGDA